MACSGRGSAGSGSRERKAGLEWGEAEMELSFKSLGFGMGVGEAGEGRPAKHKVCLHVTGCGGLDAMGSLGSLKDSTWMKAARGASVDTGVLCSCPWQVPAVAIRRGENL